jgi:hypothetical protein
MPVAHRYAVYLAPAGPYKETGSRWLGRCEDSGLALVRTPQDDPRIDAWTAEPRHYGLHATLKPPFRLAPGTRANALDAAMRQLARGQAPFAAPLELRALRGFLAWCLKDDAQAPADMAQVFTAQARMQALADQAVRDLDQFRAPPTPAEIARRRPDTLSTRQRQMLEQWGYPYVLDTFTFHMTLTGHLSETDLPQAQQALHERGADAAELPPMQVQAASVYVQPVPDAPFVVARHYAFDGSMRDGAGARFMDDDAA